MVSLVGAVAAALLVGAPAATAQPPPQREEEPPPQQQQQQQRNPLDQVDSIASVVEARALALRNARLLSIDALNRQAVELDQRVSVLSDAVPPSQEFNDAVSRLQVEMSTLYRDAVLGDGEQVEIDSSTIVDTVRELRTRVRNGRVPYIAPE
jgi:hypothetical protein